MRRRTDEDFAREIDAHVALETERLIAEGVPPDAAAHAARRAFGNMTRAQERFYESRRVLWIEELQQDVRYAVRALRRSPGFAAVAIVTLPLGIGANTVIFSVVNAVLLRPLPYRDPGSLVLAEAGEVGLTPGWAIAAWRDRARTLSGLAGFSGTSSATLIDGGEPEAVQSTNITWNLLSFLGLAPAIGRDFTQADAAPGAPPVAILSHDLWQRRFGGRLDVVGRTVTLSGAAVTIVGVSGPTFRFPSAGAMPALGVPFAQPDVMRVWTGRGFLNVIGRLDPTATTASAGDELRSLYRQAGEDEFSRDVLDRVRIDVVPLQDRLVGSLSLRLWLVMGAVTFVLLVACANVANLLLARASTRHRELALRAALGARKGRLARLLLTESVLLALLGAAGALLFAYATTGVARTLLANRAPHVGTIPIDWPVMAFNFALAAVTGLLCGLASLAGARRTNPALVFSGASTSSVTGRGFTRRVLLCAETAVTFVLVVGAVLFVQSLWNLRTGDKGFDADRLLTVRVNPGLPQDLDRRDPKAPARYWAGFFADIRERLERIAGVESAGAVSLGPLEGTAAGVTRIAVNGRVLTRDDSLVPVAFVTPGYFRTMRIPVLHGRDFTEGDRIGAELVAIVNEAFQRQFSTNGTILGARITSGSGPESFTVVGVTKDVPDKSLRTGPEPLLIAPLGQMPAMHISWGALTFVLRAREGDPRRFVPEVRRTIWAINPNIVIDGVGTMNARVAAGMRAERDSALLFGLFAVAAVVMAAIGVYGVAAYGIAQRTKELGIRVALGAGERDVRQLVVAQALRPTLVGVAIGLAGAAGLTRLVSSMVYGVTPLDPATFGVAVIILVTVALAAAWLPARRAVGIDPLVALRHE